MLLRKAVSALLDGVMWKEAVANAINYLLKVEDWTEVTPTGTGNTYDFQNLWINYDSTRKARFYKHLDRVYLAGLVKSGTINTPIFTLPSEYIPSYLDATNQNAIFPCSSNSAFASLSINYLGEVICTNGSNLWVSLDGISFRV